jgi:DNA-directed RNA polymerase beta subunit
MTFKHLVDTGVVEWVDAEEEEDLFIAAKPFVLPEQFKERQVCRTAYL